MQLAGQSMGNAVGVVLSIAGGALFILGLNLYAKMRGQHPALCLLGLISCLGMIVLYFLPKKCLHCHTGASFSAKQCGRCGAPLGA